MESLEPQIKALCRSLELGEPVEGPQALKGGLLHRMYGIRTTSGRYAVKALNPAILQRPEALANYIRSERVARLAARHISAQPALVRQGDAVHLIGGHYFMAFEWVEGRCLKPAEITVPHCERIGTVLAELHRIDFSELSLEPRLAAPGAPADWARYAELGQAQQAPWASLLAESLESLRDWNAQALQAAGQLAEGQIISHRDLDAKNIMWTEEALNPVFIDWESAGFVHPQQDLAETALYWAELPEGGYDRVRFQAFLRAYRESSGVPSLGVDWQPVLAQGFAGKLDWLEYGLKRSLGMEGTEAADRQAGTEQVAPTLYDLRRYATALPELERWLLEGFVKRS